MMNPKNLKSPRAIALLTIGLFLFAASLHAEQPAIYWVVKDGQEVNRSQAERLYREACRWVEERFGPTEQPIRPSLTVYVGEPCPDPEISGSCQGSWLGELYIPKWDDGGAGYIVQAALRLALQELVTQDQMKQVTRDLVIEDSQTFVDVQAMTKPE